MKEGTCTIGQSVVIKGELSAKEDLTIEGRVEGHIDLEQNVVTIGPNAKIQADVLAKVIRVMGTVTGDVEATESIDIRETATVEGKLAAPCVGMAPGATFQGQVDMRQGKSGSVRPKIKKLATDDAKLDGSALPEVVGLGTH